MNYPMDLIVASLDVLNTIGLVAIGLIGLFALLTIGLDEGD